MMPCWKNTTRMTIPAPNSTHCQPSMYVQVSSLNAWKSVAPMIGPHSVPLPPSSDITTMKMPKVTVGNATSSGSMKPIMLPKIAPETPRKNAESDQPMVL